MESLLRWSIENTATENSRPRTPELRQDLDPGIIDTILGKPDAVLMKEALAVGMDDTLSAEVRVTALDDLEMLVEQIDNATNLTPLMMYPQILSLLSPRTPDSVRMQALWILGTAVQNNPNAQADFLTHDPLPVILSILSPKGSQTENPASPQTRSKAAYALSATLKHNTTALLRLSEAGGWNILRDALQDSDITVRRKIVFLVYTLLLPTSTSPPELAMPNDSMPEFGPTVHIVSPPTNPLDPGTLMTTLQKPDLTCTASLTLSALREYCIVPALIESLTSPLPHGPDADGEVDLDYQEKAARALVTYLQVGGSLTYDERAQLEKIDLAPGSDIKEIWALDEREWDVLRRSVLNL